MSLYLCVFSGDTEAAAVEVGPYADFNALRRVASREDAAIAPGSLFPTLLLHSDSDGAWSVEDCARLRSELAVLAAILKAGPARPYPSDWQMAVAQARGLEPQNALESFLDVEGRFLVEALQDLVEAALELRQPILFQ